MAAPLQRDPVFGALTRPQMLAGVTYGFFVFNCVLTAELFLLTKSAWVLAVAGGLHLAGSLGCLREPRFFELWLIHVIRCPRIPNHRHWGCNSYAP